MLETHFVGKTTEKRRNFDCSTPPAGADNLHFILNRETRRAPGPPVAHIQMAWEVTDKVSLAVPCYSHRQPWARSAQPHVLTDPHLAKIEKLSNKQ
jgi:hypothetical protein